MCDAFCQQLADAGFFVIRYDHRDIGESDAVDWEVLPYTLVDLASDCVGILDHFGIKKAHFIGHSMGGHICQQVAVSFPEHILSMISIASGPIAATSETSIPLSNEEMQLLDNTWKIFLARKESDDAQETVNSFMLIWEYLNGTYLLDKGAARDYTLDLVTRGTHFEISVHLRRYYQI